MPGQSYAALQPPIRRFARFTRMYKGKSMEQVAREHGINANDINAVAGMLKE